MLFNSFQYLIFFPIVVLVYFLIPQKFRTILLLIASCYFYMAFKPIYILIIFLTIVVDYCAGILIAKTKSKKRKLYLIISIVVNVGILAFFKYFNFIAENLTILFNSFSMYQSFPTLSLIIPLGLSFHTFQAMSYTIEVYKRKQKPEKNFLTYAVYVMFFPQLVAGPIERPQHLIHQFYEKHYFDYQRITDGIKLITWGLFKKVVIADRLGIFVDQVYNNTPNSFSGISFITATIFFAYQIYYDFSGYADIAIGSAQVLGFRLVRNFNKPYFSASFSEFWQRWNISLSSWFRDYIYIPLGGNRVSLLRWQFNIMTTFFITGLWHGANWTFIVWGVLHGFYLIITRWLEILFSVFKIPVKKITSLTPIKIVRIFLTFSLVCFAWIFFRSRNIDQAIYIATHLNNGYLYYYDIIDYIGKFRAIPFETILNPIIVGKNISDLLIVLISIIGTEIVYFIQRKMSIRKSLSKKPIYIRWFLYSVLIWSILILGQFEQRDFIYFAF